MYFTGENVTICHTDPSFHAMSRRESLQGSLIDCECKRCKDPTEFGTMYNAVKCIEKYIAKSILMTYTYVGNSTRSGTIFRPEKIGARFNFEIGASK